MNNMLITATPPRQGVEERYDMIDYMVPEVAGDVRNAIVRQACKMSFGKRGGEHPMVVLSETAVQLTIDECLIMLESEEGNEQAIEIIKSHFFI